VEGNGVAPIRVRADGIFAEPGLAAVAGPIETAGLIFIQVDAAEIEEPGGKWR